MAQERYSNVSLGGRQQGGATFPGVIQCALWLACTSKAVDTGVSTSETPPAETSAPETAAPVDSAETASPEGANVLRFDGSPPTNLVVIVVDTLRKDAIGRYGEAETPFLDGLMAEGVALDAHVNTSNWTRPTVTAILSGSSTLELGWQHLLGLPTPDWVETVAEVLDGRGWATALVSANPSFNLQDGYDVDLRPGFESAERVNELALEAYAAVADEGVSWLLQLHYVDPHGAYAPPEAYRGGLESLDPVAWELDTSTGLGQLQEAWDGLSEDEQALALAHLEVLYRGEVRYLDDQLAELFASLEALSALDDALVLFVADHGESFMDHGTWDHGRSLHAEEVDGVAFFWSKGLVADAWDQPTCHQDLLPTALDGMGREPMPRATGGVVGEHAREGCATLQAISEADVSLGWSTPSRRLIVGLDGSAELYDLHADPEALDSVYSADHPDLPELWAGLEPEVERARRIFTALEAVPPPHVEAYDELGYLLDEAGDFETVSAGALHVCALDGGGAVTCWGDDRFGEVSDAPSGTFTSLSAGDTHTCALATDGSVSCWGDDGQGQVSGAPASASAVAAGVEHSCAVVDGSVSCWGAPLGEAPAGTSVVAGQDWACADDDGWTCWGELSCQEEVCPPEGVGSLSLGDLHGCGLDGSGVPRCWDRNDSTLASLVGQTTTPEVGGFVQVVSGGYHSCAVSGQGNLVCWGSNAFGQGEAPSDVVFDELAAGRDRTCGLVAGERVVCWGLFGPQ